MRSYLLVQYLLNLVHILPQAFVAAKVSHWSRRSEQRRCGDGILSEGEECDCGKLKCFEKCCDPVTCRAKQGAVCAMGECCDLETCQTRKGVCGEADGLCELQSMCDGISGVCRHIYQADGVKCSASAYCLKGRCVSHELACKEIFSSSAADDDCYNLNSAKKLNLMFNCGDEKEISMCKQENRMCGTLICNSPPTSLPLSSHTTTSLYNNKQCVMMKEFKGVSNKVVYVPDGAACAPARMCVAQKCVRRSWVLFEAKTKDKEMESMIAPQIGVALFENWKLACLNDVCGSRNRSYDLHK